MQTSARLPEELTGLQGFAAAAAGAAGRFVARNPVAVGSVTAFAITLFYVSANAVWYQPHAHGTPLFATRDFSGYRQPVLDQARFGERQSRVLIREEAPSAAANRPAGNPDIARVQEILASLKLYDGTVDGLSGPRTRDAVKAYQRIVGLPVNGEINAGLLAQLNGRASPGTMSPVVQASYDPGENVPLPRPAPRGEQPAIASAPVPVAPGETTASIPVASPIVQKVQAGLRSFGNDHIEIDGLSGAKTRAAIREFQALFGLPETGEADAPLLAKMKEIGLVN